MLAAFHPLIARWFERRFGEPTLPQREGWPRIAAGADTLIAAPTGSGKTLAAFLSALDALIKRGLEGPLPEETSILYVSPLKALSNDVSKNLQVPLEELAADARALGITFPEVRVAVRTGDTPASERQRMAKSVPHILVTTPESLYILLTSARARDRLAKVGTVIVDEIHAIADDKRGSHLALSLERLDALVRASSDRRPQRIGLSATQRPMDEIARFLAGSGRPMPAIVDAGFSRKLDLAVEVPSEELGAVASHEMMEEVYDRIAKMTEAHRTTLVFVNTRRLVERVAHQLGQRIGDDKVAAHHGSLSRATRLSAEQRLKTAELRCVVATASLELGIDVGAVELVVQIGSPRAIATFLQRVGRSGHSLGATPKGRLFALTRDQLVECASLVVAVRKGELDAIAVPETPLDILAQQLVAAAAEGEWSEEGLFQLAKSAYPFRNLTREDFDDVMEMLSEGITTGKGRTRTYLHRDRINGQVRARKGARLTAITSGGAIPDNADYAVIAEPEETFVGTLHEDFAIESMAGDIFLLGNTSWRIRRVEAGRVRVEDAAGAPPTIPFWIGEAPARTFELSREVSLLRAEIDRRLTAGVPDAEIAAWVAEAATLDPRGAAQMVEYLAAARNVLGAMPTQTTIVAERFFDEAGGMQLVIHAPLGGRINRAWGLALRKRFCRSFNFELQAAATDDGIVISLGPMHSFPLEAIFEWLSPETVREVLEQAVLGAPIFGVRWRWNAQRALAVPRHSGGKKVPPPILRMRTDDLLASVFPMAQACQENVPAEIELPDHPLVKQTMRDCLEEAMDLDGLAALLASIREGAVRTVARDTAEPSFLSHELLNANPYAYLDDAPLEERRARAVTLRRGGLPPGVDGRDMAALDAQAIATAESEAEPEVRDADELHDLLLTLGLIPEVVILEQGKAENGVSRAEWMDHFDALVAARRASRVVYDAPEETAGGAIPWMLPVRGQVAYARREDDAAGGRPSRGLAREGEPGGPRSPETATAPARGTVDALRSAWIAAERVPLVQAALGGRFRGLAPELPPLPFAVEPVSPADAVRSIVRGHIEQSAPISVAGLAAKLGLDPSDVEFALLALEAEGAVLRGRFTPEATRAGEDAPLEWCDRRILARIHRLTIGRLRREIEPVTQAELMRFLFRWQHVREGTRLHGVPGTLEIIAQLEGLELSAAAWEREVLPARIEDYDRSALDQLSAQGEIVWGRLSTREARDGHQLSRAIPLAIVLREDLPWLLVPDGQGDGEAPVLSAAAREVLDHLDQRGASFLREIVQSTRRLPYEIEDALRELVYAGHITADGFYGLRALLDRNLGDQVRSMRHDRFARFDPYQRATNAPDGTRSTRVQGWAGFAGPGPRPARVSRYRLDRGKGTTGAAAREGARSGGRWSLLRRGIEIAPDAEAHARLLLARYGVVFRDLLRRETRIPPWRDLLMVLRRMEARGEVRGGRFVGGFVGEQYALPDAVEGLRAMRKEGDREVPELIRIAATDPLNLAGIVSPGTRVPAVPGNMVLYRNGVAVAAREAGEVIVRAPLPPGTTVDADLILRSAGEAEPEAERRTRRATVSVQQRRRPE